MKQQIPKSVCPKCGGRGHVEIPQTLKETWEDLRDHGESAPSEIFDRMGTTDIRVTAIYARLEELMEYHLVKRRKVPGRGYIYSIMSCEELKQFSSVADGAEE